MMFFTKTAAFLIAISPLWTLAAAPKVYRCGSSYSQVPCEGAVAVEAQDERSKAAKAEADKATRRDLKQAESMEKARAKDEAQALKLSQPAAPEGQNKAKEKTGEKASAASKKKEPEVFTARVVSDKSKTSTKNSTDKTGDTAK